MNNKYILGVDVGGTSIKFGLFNTKLELIKKWSLDTNSDKNNDILKIIEQSCLDNLRENKIGISSVIGMGIDIPGPILNKRYLISKCANLNLDKMDIIDKFNFPKNFRITVENDANMATVGEFACGSGQLCSDLILITIGTGIGCGVISNGKLVTGSNGAAGEIGHMLIPNIFLDEFSNQDFTEFEKLTSAKYFESLAEKFINTNNYKDSILNEIGISAKNIFDNEDDTLCKKLIDIYSKNFALGLSYVCSTTNPKKIILGGGMSAAKNLINNINLYYDKFTYKFNKKNVEFEIAKLGNDAGIYGCAASILFEYYDECYVNLIHHCGYENVKTNVEGKDICTFKIGGKIKYFITPNTTKQLSDSIKYLNTNNIKYFIIGEGSNILFDDNGYDGVIISLKKLNYNLAYNEKNSLIIAPSYETLKNLSEFALKNSIEGFEFYHDIPGSVGGAIYMNAGAYESETSFLVESVTLLDSLGNIKTLTKDDMNFSYRHSIIQHTHDIVLYVTYNAPKGNINKIREKMQNLYDKRISKQPLEYPSSGSIFKRPKGYFAGQLITECDLKGFSIGDAQVSTKHAGFIINKGNATSTQVMTLINYIIYKVRATKNVQLETEVILLK